MHIMQVYVVSYNYITKIVVAII